MNNTDTKNTQHVLLAMTPNGNFRVGGKSDWKNAMRRFDAATHGGRNTNVTVRAFLDGSWQTFDGYLAVRSADDPTYCDAALANSPKLTGTDRVTVRAADYRKVR